MKTSGADGIHVVAPILRRSTFEQTYDFAERASRLLERRHPGKVTTEWLKRKREGVLVDHRQNGCGKTIASVYSVRPKPGAPVSTPLHWDELTPDVRPRQFSMEVALERIAEHGDLFAPVLSEARPLGPAPEGARAARRERLDRRLGVVLDVAAHLAARARPSAAARPGGAPCRSRPTRPRR